MKDIEIILPDQPGMLALAGETLGKYAISLEGGGMFRVNGVCIGHFLVAEAARAKEVLEDAGIEVRAVNDVLVQKLRQDVPGQLGLFCRRLADAGVNILVQYSDHANQLIIVADNPGKAKKVSEAWMKEWWQFGV